MSVFEIKPASLTNGAFAAAWFDDEECLWDVPSLHRAPRLQSDWTAPRLRLHRPEQGATPVLFNPNALAVSQGLRDELARHSELEFLPVHIENNGTFFILHATSTYDLPVGSSASANSVSKNIVDVTSFPSEFDPTAAFFTVKQPPESASGRANGCLRRLFANRLGAQSILAFAHGYLTAKEFPRTR